MKRFMKWAALLAMMSLLLGGLTACDSSSEPENNAVSGNWYRVDGSEITTIKLNAEGGGSLAGSPVSYTLSDDGTSLSLTIGEETFDLSIEEDVTYGTVLKSDGTVYALRDKAAAKGLAENGRPSTYADILIGTWYGYTGASGLSELTFSEDGLVETNGATASYTIEDDKVTLSKDGSTYVLYIAEDATQGWILKDVNGNPEVWKDPEAAKTYGKDPEAAKTAGKAVPSDVEAYIGVWDAERLSYQGRDLTTEEVGMEFYFEIKEDGTAVAVTNGEPDGDATWTYNKDGTITLKDSTGELDPFFIDEEGFLHVILQADNGKIEFYCKKR